MPRFKNLKLDLGAMVVITYQEQLEPGTFEQAVHYLIEHKLDLSVFHPKYRNADTGRLAYDPAMLLKIILFVYSRASLLAARCSDAARPTCIFDALSCDIVPFYHVSQICQQPCRGD